MGDTPMKVALVYPSVVLENNWATLKVENEQQGVVPPLSLAYVGAILEKAGHEAIIIDVNAEKLSFDDVEDTLRTFSPDLLGLTVTTYGFPQTLTYIRKLKQATGLKILVGGWHLSLYPSETMSHPEIDYAVIGEADPSLPMLMDSIDRRAPLHGIPGIAYRTESGDIRVNPPLQEVSGADDLPWPARHLLKNEAYHNILSRRKNFTAIISAFGCPFRCAFCDQNTKEFRQRSAKDFVDEIDIANRKYGIRDIDVHDSSFTVNRKRVIEITDDLKRRQLDVQFTVRTRVDCVDRDILRRLKDAGCTTIMYGIESGDPEILSILRKGVDLKKIREVVTWTRRCGIKSLGFFMIGSPGETIETARKTIHFAKTLDLDYVRFSRVTPLPNTEIYRMYMQDYGRDYWAEHTLDPDSAGSLPLVRTDITEAMAYDLIKQAYISYYFRPRQLLRRIVGVRSLLEFRSLSIAAIELLRA
jgi:anaerobic magnesium-protoporphyrin IX monomethyl ester cyclase